MAETYETTEILTKLKEGWILFMYVIVIAEALELVELLYRNTRIVYMHCVLSQKKNRNTSKFQHLVEMPTVYRP